MGITKPKPENDKLTRVTTRDAARELNMNIEAVQYLMQQDRLPIGYAIKKKGNTRYTYYIYRGLLNDYKDQLRG